MAREVRPSEADIVASKDVDDRARMMAIATDVVHRVSVVLGKGRHLVVDDVVCESGMADVSIVAKERPFGTLYRVHAWCPVTAESDEVLRVVLTSLVVDGGKFFRKPSSMSPSHNVGVWVVTGRTSQTAIEQVSSIRARRGALTMTGFFDPKDVGQRELRTRLDGRQKATIRLRDEKTGDALTVTGTGRFVVVDEAGDLRRFRAIVKQGMTIDDEVRRLVRDHVNGPINGGLEPVDFNVDDSTKLYDAFQARPPRHQIGPGSWLVDYRLDPHPDTAPETRAAMHESLRALSRAAVPAEGVPLESCSAVVDMHVNGAWEKVEGVSSVSVHRERYSEDRLDLGLRNAGPLTVFGDGSNHFRVLWKDGDMRVTEFFGRVQSSGPDYFRAEIVTRFVGSIIGETAE